MQSGQPASHVSLLLEHLQEHYRPQFVVKKAERGRGAVAHGLFVANCVVAGVQHQEAYSNTKSGARELAARNALRALGCIAGEEAGFMDPHASGASFISELTEYSQQALIPRIVVQPSSGPGSSCFTATCEVMGNKFIGSGSSKSRAREEMARVAMETLAIVSEPSTQQRIADRAQRHSEIGDALACCPVLVPTKPARKESGSDEESRRHEMVQLVQFKLESMYQEACRNGVVLPPAATSVVAAFILARGRHLTVVAVATGTKHLAQEYIGSSVGARLLDSHAEVLARRALVRYLAAQLSADRAETDTDAIFSGGRLRDDVEFHLYISTAPCGDARRFLSSHVPSTMTTLKRRHPDSELEQRRRDHCPALSSPEMGKLTTKISAGMGCSPTDSTGTPVERRCSMSCSDKLLKWVTRGLQGGLLLSVIERPVKLSSVIVGSCVNMPDLERALCCRTPNGCLGLPIYGVVKPVAAGTTVTRPGTTTTTATSSTNTTCLNWYEGATAGTECTNARTGLRVQYQNTTTHDSPKSRLCKRELAQCLVETAGVKAFCPGETYLNWKYRVVRNSENRGGAVQSCVERVRGTAWAHRCHLDDFLMPGKF
jgi:hypothetical protein